MLAVLRAKRKESPLVRRVIKLTMMMTTRCTLGVDLDAFHFAEDRNYNFFFLQDKGKKIVLANTNPFVFVFRFGRWLQFPGLLFVCVLLNYGYAHIYIYVCMWSQESHHIRLASMCYVSIWFDGFWFGPIRIHIPE